LRKAEVRFVRDGMVVSIKVILFHFDTLFCANLRFSLKQTRSFPCEAKEHKFCGFCQSQSFPSSIDSLCAAC
jgi:hypothetical protein